MFLVQVHAEVSATARNLLERTLAALIVDTVEQALECFRQIRQFGRGGMLRVAVSVWAQLEVQADTVHQATLEIEFMHQTVVQYVNDSASRTLTEIYTTISNAYAQRQGGIRGADEGLQQELSGVKQTLLEVRRVTTVQFKCFRRPKEKAVAKGQGGRGAEENGRG